jgi:hypothetical protein
MPAPCALPPQVQQAVLPADVYEMAVAEGKRLEDVRRGEIRLQQVVHSRTYSHVSLRSKWDMQDRGQHKRPVKQMEHLRVD